MAKADSIGVVIPVRNRPKLVAEAIGSVSPCLKPGDRLIVVDNNSSDDTVDAAQAAGAKVIIEPHPGPSAARNCGIRALDTAWVTFLDSDDLALPCWLEQFRSAVNAADSAMVFWPVIRETTGKVIAPAAAGSLFADIPVLFLSGTFAVKRDLLIEAGLYDVGLRFGENTELGIRLCQHILRRGLKVVYGESPGVLMRDGAEVRAGFNDLEALRAAERTLSMHDDAFSNDLKTKAAYLRVAGIRAVRLGMKERAIGHLVRAALVEPCPKAAARVVASLFAFESFRSVLLRRAEKARSHAPF